MYVHSRAQLIVVNVSFLRVCDTAAATVETKANLTKFPLTNL